MATSTPRILIVDDDPLIAHLLRDVFVAQGIAVALCSDGETALQHARAEPPDVVLLDVNVPGCDGFDLCRLLRETEHEDRHATIVMITARNDTTSKLLAFSVGADDYLVKPVDVREIRSRVARWFDRRAYHAGVVLRRRREAIQEIVAALCHELNNPLQAAVLGVEVARDHLEPGHPSLQGLQVIDEHLGRIREILVRLQDVDDRTVPYIGQARMIEIRPRRGAKEHQSG